jgi:hypothetical protein
MITLTEPELKQLIQNHLRHSKAIRCEINDIHLNTDADGITAYVYKDEPDGD